ncbi:MAG: YbjN domain-containing protein [Gemmataceae bacterium]|nr:YbjN domain-containing protein [Gemmataceae bacterium]
MKRTSNWVMAACLAVALGATWTAPLAAQPPVLKGSDADQPATLESIKTVLDNMGYEYEANKDKEGKVTSYAVKLSRDGWNFVITVSPSGNQRWIWLTAWLRKPKEGWPASILQKMLEHNHRVALPYFAIDQSDSQVKLSTPLHNRAITPALLRTNIDDLCTNLKNTVSLWDPEKWDTAIKASAR